MFLQLGRHSVRHGLESKYVESKKLPCHRESIRMGYSTKRKPLLRIKQRLHSLISKRRRYAY
jgi:hypothetical protein